MNKRAKKQKHRARPWPFVLIALLFLIIIMLVYALIHQPVSGSEPPAENDRPALTVDPNAGEKITPTPAPTEPGIAIPGWTSIKLPAGATEAYVSLNNPEDNAGWYYLTFELRLKETNEVIFTTGLIPPGQYLNKVILTRELEAGTYPAILHVQPYRMADAQSPTNNADLDIQMIVE